MSVLAHTNERYLGQSQVQTQRVVASCHRGCCPVYKNDNKSDGSRHRLVSASTSVVLSIKKPETLVSGAFGGDNKTRTCDLMYVKHAL